MASLQEILQKHTEIKEDVEITLGAGKSNRIHRESLLKDLRQHSKSNEKYFIVGVLMLVALFITMIVVTLKQLNNPDTIKVVMAAFGGSATLLVSRMFKMWREKNLTDVLLWVGLSEGEEKFKAIVEALAKRL